MKIQVCLTQLLEIILLLVVWVLGHSLKIENTNDNSVFNNNMDEETEV